MSTIGLLVAIAGFAFVLVCVALVSPRFHRDQPPADDPPHEHDTPGPH